jgi:hypothetical protein
MTTRSGPADAIMTFSLGLAGDPLADKSAVDGIIDCNYARADMLY